MKPIHEIVMDVYVDCFGCEVAADDAVIDYAIRVAMEVIDDRLPKARWSGCIGETGVREMP